MSDHEDKECLLELHADPNLMLLANEKLSLYWKKRLLCLQKKGRTAKHTPYKVWQNKFKLYRNDVDVEGIYKKMDLTQTYWYRNYVLFPNHASKRFNTKFRLRFCLPHGGFTSLLEEMKDSHYFSKWDPNKTTKGKKIAVPWACCY